ncbi:MAG: preprotein translocase subunit YajC [Anaerovoracaceae bacterium]
MGNGNIWVTILPLVILIAVMYLLLIRPQKKREKEINAMRSSVQVGDEIITIGGICGKVVKTKEDSLVIQVGADRVKFEIMRWAVSKVVEEGAKHNAKVHEDEVDTEEETEVKKSKPKRMKKAEPAAEEAEETEASESEEAEETTETAEEENK